MRVCVRKGSRVAAATVFLLAACLPAAAGQAGVGRADRIEEIRALVRGEMARQGIPGLSLAIAEDFRPLLSEGFGLADVEHSVQVKRATVFRLGSISKPITAVAAMQLFETGRLDLDAPIQKYVPGFPEKPWPVTARALLGHTSGIRHYGAPSEFDSTRHYADVVTPLAIFKDDPLLFEPGQRFSYTTYGYNLLGAAIEGASGLRFMDYLKERVFGPARMSNAREDDQTAIIPNRARGYRMSANSMLLNCGLADTSNKIPGGGMVSTAEDLVRFAVAFSRGTLLKKETVETMLTAPVLASGAASPYGLGWFVADRGGRKWAEHTGSQQGTSTVLLALPANGLAVAILTNLERANVAPLAMKIGEMLLNGDVR